MTDVLPKTKTLKKNFAVATNLLQWSFLTTGTM